MVFAGQDWLRVANSAVAAAALSILLVMPGSMVEAVRLHGPVEHMGITRQMTE